MPYSEYIKSLLEDMQAEEQRVSEQTTDHWVRARSLHPDTARLLLILARSLQAKNILEVGTSVGYSTIQLALAAQENGGHVITLELLPTKYQQAETNLKRAELTPYVTQRLGDARVIVPDLTQTWDLVFIDAEKDVYLDMWHLIKDHVRLGGLILADNAVSHADDLAHYTEAVLADPRFDTVTLSIGQGIEVTSRKMY